MNITHLNQFLETYFINHKCDVLSNDDGIISVQLTEEMDRALMNRPFYWHYIKSIGQKGDPMKLSLITNPEKRLEQGEWIHFGSPRLQQIMNHLRQNEKYIKLFQTIHTTVNIALFPWLLTNIKISYQGKQKKDELFSIGLNLVNGMMKVEMMELLDEITLSKTISDYCYSISPIIKLQSGYYRIESVIDNYIQDQKHTWADEALQTMKEEIEMVEHFYSDDSNLEEKQKEIDDIKERFKPSITYEVVNGGIIYLTEDFQ
ncbi:MAG TPA: YqhG family protein [Virgibacillus sp.]|nr:YqhG family protein [Virgibacillus sp.]